MFTEQIMKKHRDRSKDEETEIEQIMKNYRDRSKIEET